MKLLLLLLPVCASAFFIPGLFGNKGKELNEHRSGKLSEEGKAKLAKMWGINLEARKARLERINKKAAESLKKSVKSESELKESLKEIVPVKISSEKKVHSLLEINNKKGVAEYLHQGDIHLSERQLDALENAGNNRQKRLAWAFANRWADNTLFYAFDDSILEEQKTTIRDALAYFQQHTCVSFEEDANAVNKVMVYRGDGCSSGLGMEGGTQWLSLGQGCEVIGTAAHEFLHALGFDHTQSRSDRNDYVDVDLSDVNQNWYGNFEQYTAAQNILYVPYEYGSVMHYSANSFVNTQGQLSIVPNDATYTYTMGNALTSFYDILMVNDHYSCHDNCPAATSAVCQNGGYPNPSNCAVCNCPRGYGGALCDEIPTGCASTVEATEEWQPFHINLGDANDENIKDVFSTCNDWITAPEGKRIQVRITGMENEYCDYGCPVNGIEIKADVNTSFTNPMFCCEEFNNRIITSKLNPTPIFSFNRFNLVSFVIEYRFVDAEEIPATTTPSPTTTTEKKTTTTAVKTTEAPTEKPKTEAPTTTTEKKTTTTAVKTTEAPTEKPKTEAPTQTPATEAPTKKPTTKAPVDPNCVNPLTISQVTLKRMYSDGDIGLHRYHSSNYYIQRWTAQGFKQNGQIGKVIDATVYETNTALFNSSCPSLVKLYTFVLDGGLEFMTADAAEAQEMIRFGWIETLPVGYCSSTKACGANRNLRSVNSHFDGDIVYSTYNGELNHLNNSPRYKGTLSPTICWLF